MTIAMKIVLVKSPLTLRKIERERERERVNITVL